MKNFFSTFARVWKSEDIRRKLVMTLVLLAIYRIAANVPAPGVDQEVLRAFREASGGNGTFLDFLNLLSGGTVSNFSLLSMGVYPYITAQIILQLLVPIIPALQRKMEEDPREGRRWQEKWTYYISVPMAMLSAIGQIGLFNNLSIQALQKPVLNFGFTPELWLKSTTVLIAMTAGTMFAIWLGELISEYGIRGQGLSLVIFAGIVAQLPQNLFSLFSDRETALFMIIFTIIVIVFTVIAIVYVQQGRRNVPVMYPGRRIGNRMSMPVKGTLPLMVNLSGMIPLIFASAILQFPAVVAGFLTQWFPDSEGLKSFALTMTNFFGGTGTNNWGYWSLYFLMVVVFTFFYTSVLFDQQNYGDNLKKSGASIPGVHTGAPTQKYLSTVQRRITLPGALFLGLVAAMPFLLNLLLGLFNMQATSQAGLFLVSSSGLLIVVGVVRDMFMNIDAELKLHGYQESLLVR
ncbi:MAG: preprotein translocase subunit SecY [Anaerolineales bacterium]|nr:preprotein translocase subunit SecY [Anaerolineales bacterium]